ncbi:MAG: ATP-binding cassette domain-containing protein [Clostridiales bacterium]|nr:ATP-binding cassette domain-containing protein [Clostridiales bacterium]
MLYEAKHVSKAFGKEIVIKDFNLQINKGEMVAIVGKKESGKTTLAQILAGFIKPSIGEIRTATRVVSSKKSASGIRKLRRSHISYVSAEPVLINEMTVYENLLLADKKNPGTNRSKKAKAKNTLKLAGLFGKGHYMPSELSTAEKKKVCIARAIITKPILLILDEPTALLDEKNAYAVIDILQKLNQNGMTIILTTKNKVVASCCTRVVGINRETDISSISSNRITPVDISSVAGSKKASSDNMASPEQYEDEESYEDEYQDGEYADEEAYEDEYPDYEDADEEAYEDEYPDEEYDEQYVDEYDDRYSEEEYDDYDEDGEYSGEYDDDDEEDYNDPEVSRLINQIKDKERQYDIKNGEKFVMPEIDLTNIFDDKE